MITLMFGLNKVVTPRGFSNQEEHTLKVTSVFYTLQGEGPFAGTPCIFVRLSHCHLACKFCDTWFDDGETLSFSDIIAAARESVDRFNEEHNGQISDLPYLFVITGGEPLLQPQLVPFIGYLQSIFGIQVQIETTGTIDVDIPLGKLVPRNKWGVYVVCSPKLNARGQSLHISSSMLDRIDCMKCVISKTDSNYNKIPEFVLKWRDDHPDRPVYVSPMNVYLKQPIKLDASGTLMGRSEVNERVSFWTVGLLDHRANQQNHEYAAELALRHRVKLTLQSHLYASLP